VYTLKHTKVCNIRILHMYTSILYMRVYNTHVRNVSMHTLQYTNVYNRALKRTSCTQYDSRIYAIWPYRERVLHGGLSCTHTHTHTHTHAHTRTLTLTHRAQICNIYNARITKYMYVHRVQKRTLCANITYVYVYNARMYIIHICM